MLQWNTYSRHLWECPDYRGVLISGVNLYYKAQFETFAAVLNTGVSATEGFYYYSLIPRISL